MDRLTELNVLLRTENATVLSILEMLANMAKGLRKAPSITQIYQKIAKKFGIFKAWCPSCERFLERECFPAWRRLPMNQWPTHVTRIRCETCLRGIVKTQAGHTPKAFIVNLDGQDYYVAARLRNEAVSLLMRSKRRGLDANLWNKQAQTYNKVPIFWIEVQRGSNGNTRNPRRGSGGEAGRSDTDLCGALRREAVR